MRLNDLIFISEKGLKHHRLRTFLTLLGIVISIAAVYSFLLLADGLTNVVEKRIASLGTDIIRVAPKTGPVGYLVTFDDQDVQRIERIEGVESVVPVMFSTVIIKFESHTLSSFGFGVQPDLLGILLERTETSFLEGKPWDKNAEEEVILGYSFAKDRFPKEIKEKDTLIINNRSFKVRGILEPGMAMLRNIVAIPLETLKEITNNTEDAKYNIMIVFYNIKYDANKIKEKIENVLKRKYDLDLIMVLTPQDLIKQVKTIMGSITFFIIAIAAVSLIISAVSIANTMYTSVLQRTQEIGIMKSFGARNKDIRNMFLVESGILGLIGGFLGIVLALIISYSAQYALFHVFGSEIILIKLKIKEGIGLIIFSILVGAMSGLSPANKASKVDPVEALRYE